MLTFNISQRPSTNLYEEDKPTQIHILCKIVCTNSTLVQSCQIQVIVHQSVMFVYQKEIEGSKEMINN